MKNKKRSLGMVLFAVILAISIFFRIFNLNIISPYPDELTYGERAADIVNGESDTIFYHDHPPLHILLISLPRLLGFDMILAGRIVSVIAGVISIILIYLLSREVYNEKAALISSFFASIFTFYVFYNRIAQIDSVLISLTLLSYYLFILGYKQKKYIFFILSGIITGIAVWDKYPAFGIPLAISLFYLYKEKSLKFVLKKEFIMFVASFCIIIIPLVIIDSFSGNSIIWELTHRFQEGGVADSPKSLFSSIILFFGYIGGIFLNTQSYPSNAYDYLFLFLGLIPFFAVLIYFFKSRKSEDFLLFVHIAVFSVFFILYSVKFQYYLLLIIVPLIPVLGEIIFKLFADARRSIPILPLFLGSIILLLVNIFNTANMLDDRGQFDGFREAVGYVSQEFKAGQILVSHNQLVEYYMRKNNLSSISVINVYEIPKEKIMDVVFDNNTKAIIMKSNYFDYYIGEEQKKAVLGKYPIQKTYGSSLFKVYLFAEPE